jgi:hypothetical protein
VNDVVVFDESGLEALSWRLASELMRRHPVDTRLIRAHPGGGQYDLLWIFDSAGGRGDIRLNRAGTIQVHGRFDRYDSIVWEPTEWDEYRASDPGAFIERLEAAAGLPSPSRARPATPITLTYRVLAAIAATADGTDQRIEIQEGYIDSSGGFGSSPNRMLAAFPIPDELLRVRDDDLYREPGYRFWIVMRNDSPIIAVEQTSGVAWIGGRNEQIGLMALYRNAHRNIRTTAANLLNMVEGF